MTEIDVAANSAAITTTETILSQYQIPAGSLVVGSTLRVTGFAQGSGTAIGTGTVTVRLGTAGTTADTSIVASGNLAIPIAATGLHWDGLAVVRTVGAGGTIIGHVEANVSGVAPVLSNSTATVAVNTTVANWLSVTAKTTATTSTIIATASHIGLEAI